MHLLNAQAGAVSDGSDPVDLEQSPGDIVVLTSADTEIMALAKAQSRATKNSPSLRLASLLQLSHNYSIDLYLENTLREAKLIVVRLLGGPSYWRYGLDEVLALARGHNIKLAVVPGDPRHDPSLHAFSTLAPDHCKRLWSYLVEGGADNMDGFLAYADHLLHGSPPPSNAAALAKAGLYRTKTAPGSNKTAAIVFYRALVQSSDTNPIDALLERLASKGLAASAYYASSLKDPEAAQILRKAFAKTPPNVVINLTAFALSQPGELFRGTVLDGQSRPVIQAVLAGQSHEVWQNSLQGLGPRDIAMNVALPEIDGRIFSRAISFKTQTKFDQKTQAPLIGHAPLEDRVDYVARLAANWVRLRKTPAANRKVALILSNYPTSDGRIANGVGLDTPAATLNVLKALKDAGYNLTEFPKTSKDLMQRLIGEKTVSLTLSRYQALLGTHIPPALCAEITERWGAPEEDPSFDKARQRFTLRVLTFGHVTLGIQPPRGYLIDPKATHHDAALLPPHAYLAFYLWLRAEFSADAVIHMGKHGNLEWLPGKALALSARCYPEAVLGALPHIYPFIVNDPGEGSQAKRRTAAVIIDHLTPPLTRAESYGPLKDLEALVDEYYEAASLDPRRLALLSDQILDLAKKSGLARDCGIAADDSEMSSLQKLDNFLCELKEMQIRGGLHIFGQSPTGEDLTDLLLALLRLPRSKAPEDASLLRALCADLGLDAARFDPLDCDFSEPWSGAKPEILLAQSNETWRSTGDTVERLELLARALVSGTVSPSKSWHHTKLVLETLRQKIAPRVASCGPAEMKALLEALDGRFVAPGPSGAPTRGRLDVLPTGRNFYAIDNRTVPTQAAWQLGAKSAERLVTTYRQDHGGWPKTFGISAWGTSNMRTGGDDIAQALALLGAKPVWDTASRRVTGFEILSLSELKRPRVDVLFRISGFFRDAFPGQIDLLDSAIGAISELDEPEDANPIKARFAAQKGDSPSIFGTRPGGYGTGLQSLIETGAWEEVEALGESYLETAAFAYGAGRDGKHNRAALETLAAKIDAVVQNQDAQEFDLLDSDDFYQFEGGLAAAVKALSGAMPELYHNDHSRPESPKIRRLETALAQVLRARALNPKWLNAMQKHGYKGASELAQTVTNLFGFAATTDTVSSQQFELLYEAYILDDDILSFLQEANPAALHDIAARFLEAERRHFWQPQRNSAHSVLTALATPRKSGV